MPLRVQVESLEKELAALAGTEVVIAKLRSRRSELEAKVGCVPIPTLLLFILLCMSVALLICLSALTHQQGSKMVFGLQLRCCQLLSPVTYFDIL